MTDITVDHYDTFSVEALLGLPQRRQPEPVVQENTRDLLDRLMTFGQDKSCAKQWVDLSAMVREVVHLLRTDVSVAIAVEDRIGFVPWIEADATDLVEKLAAFVMNATRGLGQLNKGLTVELAEQMQATDAGLDIGWEPEIRLSVREGDRSTPPFGGEFSLYFPFAIYEKAPLGEDRA